MKEELPDSFLQSFQEVCESFKKNPLSDHDVSLKVFGELHYDYPLTDQDQLDCFVGYLKEEQENIKDCKNRDFIPTRSFLKGILSVIDEYSPEEQTSDDDSSETRVLKYSEILLVSVFLPILSNFNDIDKLSCFLSSYKLDKQKQDEIIPSDSEVIEVEDNTQVFEEDDSDFEWESYEDSPNTIDVEDNNNSGTITIDESTWNLKIDDIFNLITESFYDIVFSSELSKGYSVHSSICNTIHCLMECLTDENSVYNSEFIARLCYILQNQLARNVNDIPSNFLPIFNELREKEDSNVVRVQLKQILRLNLLSHLSENIITKNTLERNNQAFFKLAEAIKTQLEYYKERIYIIKGIIEPLLKESVESEYSKGENILSGAVIELASITKCLLLIVKTEIGQVDSEISSKLLGEQVIQQLVLLFISLQKSSNNHPFLQRLISDTGNGFLIQAAIYQPSIGIYLSKIRGLSQLYSSADFQKRFPQFSSIYFILLYLRSSYKDTKAYDNTCKYFILISNTS